MTARRIARILVPLDFGPASQAALTYAKMLAIMFRASLHLLHVMDDALRGGAPAAEAHSAMPAGLDGVLQIDAGTRLANLLSREEITRFHATCAIVFGTTAASIAQYAEQHDIDLIVMGTHGRREVAHAVLGSVAECVVRTAKCRVLTVRESGAVKLRNFDDELTDALAPAHT